MFLQGFGADGRQLGTYSRTTRLTPRSVFMMLLRGSRTFRVGVELQAKDKSIIRDRKQKARMRRIGNPGVCVFDENVFLSKVRNRSPVSSPNKRGSCTVIRRRFNALDCFTSMVRDQEVDGSNPFAPIIYS
jgi:hypothetical protein